MRDKILTQALESLHTEGLRFSVDALAARMKISKKTVYKYFPTKEALALAMYERYYAALSQTMARLLDTAECDRAHLLRAYLDAKQLSREEIFNQYKLNDVIRAYTAEQNDRLWALACSTLCASLDPAQKAAARMIVDGAVERLCRTGEPVDDVIELLVKLL